MSKNTDETKHTRVTSVLAIYSNYDKVPENILNYTTERGTRIHKYCELYALNMLFETVDLDCVEYVQAFIDFFDENVEKVIHAEKRFFCDESLFQGQVDLICYLKNYQGASLIDIKSSLKYSKTWNLQTAAYKHLAVTNNFEVDNRLVLQVKKDSKFQIYEFQEENYKDEIDLYMQILKAHRYFS